MCKDPEKNLFGLKCFKCGELTPYPTNKGKVAICGMDIGNNFDTGLRVIDAIKTADIIICENAYWFNVKINNLNITTNSTILEFKDLEINKINSIIDNVNLGKNIALVSNDGMPFIMEPGYWIIDVFRNAGIDVMIMPGPDTPVTALHASGFNSWSFVFEGNIPSNDLDKTEVFNKLINENKTVIFFEYNKRLYQSIKYLSKIINLDRRLALCFNLTKKDENVIKGSIKDVLNWLEKNKYAEIEVPGEEVVAVTIVIEGSKPQLPPKSF
jgi:16S rRNA (cytidine1402-2'-O)-methyltransferase